MFLRLRTGAPQPGQRRTKTDGGGAGVAKPWVAHVLAITPYFARRPAAEVRSTERDFRPWRREDGRLDRTSSKTGREPSAAIHAASVAAAARVLPRVPGHVDRRRRGTRNPRSCWRMVKERWWNRWRRDRGGGGWLVGG